MTTFALTLIGIELGIVALVAVLAGLALRRRAVRPVVISQPPDQLFSRLTPAEQIFRRPAEFGPLTPLGWDRVYEIRERILKAQFRPGEDDDDSVCVDFSARRCWLPSASVTSEREGVVSVTYQRAGVVEVEAGRVGLRRWLDEPDYDERFDHWLEQWDESPLVALTGRGLAA